MTDKEVMQQALEALENSSPDQYPEDAGVFYGAITALRTALGQQAEPVSHAAIAGALFDFMGWLTTRKKRLVLSSTDNASPAVESITEFAKMRGLSLDDAKVQDWNTSLPQQQAEPVAWAVQACSKMWRGEFAEIDSKAEAKRIGGTCVAYALYTTPPQRQWQGLTDEDMKDHKTHIFDFIYGARWAEAKLKERNT